MNISLIFEFIKTFYDYDGYVCYENSYRKFSKVYNEKHNKNKNFVYFIASINNFHGHFIFYWFSFFSFQYEFISYKSLSEAEQSSTSTWACGKW